jgi:undecaprenyl-diphosphatase
VAAAADARGPAAAAAAVLAETAREAAAQTEEGAQVVAAARAALGPDAAVPAEARHGADLLKDAVLHRLGPLQSLDARIFLVINRVPHPAWSDRLANLITVWTTGGWIWAGGLLAARALGVRDAGKALVILLPSMTAATWIVEYPIKAFFRRQRPFIDVVRALVVGKKPGSWSFPSGHTASSFACAWMLARCWPRLAPLFFAVAGSVGFSRIYVGAHYPGDVTTGAFCGMAIAELVRILSQVAARRFRRRR